MFAGKLPDEEPVLGNEDLIKNAHTFLDDLLEDQVEQLASRTLEDLANPECLANLAIVPVDSFFCGATDSAVQLVFVTFTIDDPAKVDLPSSRFRIEVK
eukprot:gene3123-3400_t